MGPRSRLSASDKSAALPNHTNSDDGQVEMMWPASLQPHIL